MRGCTRGRGRGAGRPWRLGLALCVLAPAAAPRLLQNTPEAGQEAQASEEAPAAEGEAPAAGEPADAAPATPEPPRYRTADELDPVLQGWLGSGLAERIELGTTAGGRPIVGVVFGGTGQVPLAERPTVLLVGALDGRSVAGAEAVLRVAEELLAMPDKLPAEVAFLAVPWANPDGIARQLESGAGGGRNDQPGDEDRDGEVDEDGPDDLDGDGAITSLLLEDLSGPWARAEDDRLLRPARPGDAPRYRIVREGRDDDGDGRFNEDGPGGIVPDLDFPVDWRGPWTGAPTGPWPLSAPAARALADLALSRRVALALFFQGNHGGVAAPGGLASGGALGEGSRGAYAPDRVAFELAGRRFAAATGRPERPVQPLFAARGEERPGAALDWLYLARGALAIEVAAWGPEVESGARVRPQDARFVAEPKPAHDGPEPGGVDERQAPELERSWARWIDNTRGGIGFLDWQPIDLGGGRSGLLGGWLPNTRLNPPPELLPAAVRGLGDFVRTLAGDLPRLEIELVENERTGGEVVVLRVRVRNRGALPTGVGAASNGLGLNLRLQAPEGVEVLVGEREHALGHLAGGGSSVELSWILMMSEGASVTLRAETSWLAPTVREVRP
ncbi:MAG: M14 family zinc carboxypeptidase [Planctomycetota bacterium]